MEKIKKLLVKKREIEDDIENLQNELDDIEYDLFNEIVDYLTMQGYDRDELKTEYTVDDLINELQ